MIKIRFALIVCCVVAPVMIERSMGALIITIEEVGNTVVFTPTGTLDTSGGVFSPVQAAHDVSSAFGPIPTPGSISFVNSVGALTPISGTNFSSPLTLEGDFPASLGRVDRDDGSQVGNAFGYSTFSSNSNVYFPTGYVSNEVFPNTAIVITSSSFADFPFDEGDQWKATLPNNDTIEFRVIPRVIPEPSSSILLVLAGIAIAIRRRRRR